MNDTSAAPRRAGEADEPAGWLAALGEPVRWTLYHYVVSQPAPVGRDQAATALGIPRYTAKLHLDRLQADGLLDVGYARPPGRNGPGAGHPAKRYHRADREIALSLPERHYDLAGQLMARAIDQATRSGARVADTLRHVAAAEGRNLGSAAARAAAGEHASQPALIRLLAEYGYEPRKDRQQIILANCPFHRLSQALPDLVCGMNLDLIRGMLQTAGPHGLQARLDPAPGRCCVTLTYTDPTSAQAPPAAGARRQTTAKYPVRER